jgi:hypothetical protein
MDRAGRELEGRVRLKLLLILLGLSWSLAGCSLWLILAAWSRTMARISKPNTRRLRFNFIKSDFGVVQDFGLVQVFYNAKLSKLFSDASTCQYLAHL